VLYIDAVRYGKQMADECRKVSAAAPPQVPAVAVAENSTARDTDTGTAGLLREIERLEREMEIRHQQLVDLNNSVASLILSLSNASAIEDGLVLRALQTEREQADRELQAVRTELGSRDRDITALQEALATCTPSLKAFGFHALT
jgi:chromosome segregation ATPase